MLALNSLTPYIRLQSFQKLRIASDRLLTRQRLRLLDWSVEHAEEVMCRTGCERDQVPEYHFAEYADHRYLSGPPQEVLVPYRGRTYRTKHAFRRPDFYTVRQEGQHSVSLGPY